MSEIDVKQAVDEIVARLNPNEVAGVNLAKLFEPIIQKHFDTATAKLREELVAMQNEVIRLNGLLRVSNTERHDAQLARQQPSEQCPKCDQLPAAHKEKCEQPKWDRITNPPPSPRGP